MNRILLLLLVLSVIISCKKGKDDEDPVLTFLRVNSQAEQLFVDAGSTITVETYFQDSRGLGKYTLDITGAFDGAAANKKQNYVPFTISETFTAINRQDFDLRVFVIPSNTTSGLYVVKAVAYDKGNNKSDEITFDLIIKNPSAPEITVVNPNPPAEWKFNKGDTINQFVGGITDADGLTEIKITLHKDDKPSIYTQTISFVDTLVYSYSFSSLPVPLNIPADASIGNYRINISGKDILGNYGIFRKKVRID
jgi:hypothetical protein